MGFSFTFVRTLKKEVKTLSLFRKSKIILLGKTSKYDCDNQVIQRTSSLNPYLWPHPSISVGCKQLQGIEIIHHTLDLSGHPPKNQPSHFIFVLLALIMSRSLSALLFSAVGIFRIITMFFPINDNFSKSLFIYYIVCF